MAEKSSTPANVRGALLWVFLGDKLFASMMELRLEALVADDERRE
jgi:hypothetical protein